jgi:DNA-binding CsgD family transcriptional regulator
MRDQHNDVFGRDAELSVLASFIDEAASGPTALLLEGDAGVGKTTLWMEGLEAARDQSFRVLNCRPVESETKLSFAALGDLLGELLDEVERDLSPPRARALDVALLRAEPEGAPPDSRAVSLAVLEVLRSLSRDGPVIVAIDDVQWLDTPTSRVLGFATRRLATEPVSLLLTRRSGEETAPFELDRSLPEDRFHSLAVGPMTIDALSQVVRARVGTGFLRPTLVRLHEMSGGNPFFAIQIARASSRGDQPATGQLLPVPSSLRELVRDRVAILPPETQHALLVAAALSAPTRALIQTATGVVPLDPDLKIGVEAGVIEIVGDQVRFTHPLFGTGIYSEAPPDQRRELHRRLAEIVTDPEELARHLALGADPPDSSVAAALDEAARRARSRGAPDAAAELSEMAVRFTPVDRYDDRLSRSLEAARHHVNAGAAPRARVLLEREVDAAPPSPSRARALWFLASIRPADGSWASSIEIFRRALDEVGEDRTLRGAIEQGLGYADLFTGDLAAAEPHAMSALELAEMVDDAAAVAEALQFVAYLEFARGRGVRSDLLDRAIALERETEEYWVWDQIRPTTTQAQLLKYTDRFDEARGAFEGLLDRALEHGREHPLSSFHFHLAELECWAGRWEAAEEHARACLEASIQTGETAHFRTTALYVGALVDAHRGRAEEATVAATEGFELATRVGPVMSEILNLSVLGFLGIAEADPAEAHRHLGRAVGLVAGMGVEEPALFRFLPDEVEALVALGELDRAVALLDPFEERARRLDRAWALATGARCRGLLLAATGDVPGALESLERALGDHQRVPEPFALARTYLALGQVQRRAKLKTDARGSFERALEIFGALGARPWAERAAGELSRVAPRAAGPFELTPTEERVAALVAEGRTNREVADTLFITVNTVEWNLTKIYRKLGVHSRTELAARLQS